MGSLLKSPESVTMSQEETEDEGIFDEEKAFLSEESAHSDIPQPPRLNHKFWSSAVINTISTIGIVFVNKHIFETDSLRHVQVSFAAFHFLVTAGLLYILSRPRINVFEAKRVAFLQIIPLAFAMIFNVVLQNASLAYSTIQFYQIVRTLLTPCVATLNYAISKITISRRTALTLVPICIGVAVVSYFDTLPGTNDTSKRTSLLGVIFAFSGVLASAIYTLWIGKYHKTLECTSQQLLLNQAPVSVFFMLYMIPFSDDITAFRSIGLPTWMWILLSGVLACSLNYSQFVIIDQGGALSSTIVGHFKSCCIILLGWFFSGKSFADGSVLGILLAIGGIVSYCEVTHAESRK